MKNYTAVSDINNLTQWLKEARELKSNPRRHKVLGSDKTLGLLFFNNSAFTRQGIGDRVWCAAVSNDYLR